jgi:hypothetical protein
MNWVPGRLGQGNMLSIRHLLQLPLKTHTFSQAPPLPVLPPYTEALGIGVSY